MNKRCHLYVTDRTVTNSSAFMSNRKRVLYINSSFEEDLADLRVTGFRTPSTAPEVRRTATIGSSRPDDAAGCDRGRTP
jgi:hypothetical protein